jgi:hypothetical protein
MGDRFVLSISIAYPVGCITDGCKNKFNTKIQHDIDTVYSKITLVTKFTDNEIYNVQLIFCSFDPVLPGKIIDL